MLKHIETSSSRNNVHVLTCPFEQSDTFWRIPSVRMWCPFDRQFVTWVSKKLTASILRAIKEEQLAVTAHCIIQRNSTLGDSCSEPTKIKALLVKESWMDWEEQIRRCRSKWEVTKKTENKVKQVRWGAVCVGRGKSHISYANYSHLDIFSAASRSEWTNECTVSSVFGCTKTSASWWSI